MQLSKHLPSLSSVAAACLSVIFALLVAVSFVPTAHADPVQTNTSGSSTSVQTNTSGGGTTGETIANPLKFTDLNSLLAGVLKSVVQIGSILLTLAIVLVGFRFVAARGNEEKIRSARTALMWTVIGGLILLGATAIQAVIASTVGSITS